MSLGLFLRATAMDELPQIFHILTGQMSFVGPRPLIPEELKRLDQIPRGKERLLPRPGLAGLAQLYSGKTPDLAQRLNWDLLYLDQCYLWSDVKILLKSIWVTLRGSWEHSGPKILFKETRG